MNGLAEKRQIESLDFETEILANVKEERLRLERIFSEKEGVFENKSNRKRVLELASVGEYWIAKSMLLEQLNSEPDNEEILETMAVLETYILDAENRNYWCDRLLDLFPKNIIGEKLSLIRNGEDDKDWDLVAAVSAEILKFDVGNWYSLRMSAKSNAALGNWKDSAKNWDRYHSMRDFSIDEEYDAARSYYNAKRFEKVVEITSRKREVKEERILELMIRAQYNLRSDEECVELCKEIIDINPKSEVGIRHYSRSLIRLGRLGETLPIIKKYCELYPSSVYAWESLLEVQLMMDRVEDSAHTWEELSSKSEVSMENFFTAAEVSLRFNWRDKYRGLIEKFGERYESESGFSDRLAEAHLKVGDIGGAWNAMVSNGQDPMKSFLKERLSFIIEETNSSVREIEERSNSGDPLWIAELVSREILRRSESRRPVSDGRKKCHLISSSLDRGGAERQVAMTLKHTQENHEFDCFLAVHRLENVRGIGNYLDELEGMENLVFDLGKIDIENSTQPGSEIILQNNNLLGLLDSVIKKKICQLIFHFSENKPDIVHAWQDETILTCSLAGALTGVPRILGSARSLRPDEKTELHIRKRPFLQDCFSEIFRLKENQISTNSFAGRKSYSEWIGVQEEEIHVNHNGVDFGEIESRMDLREIRGRFEEFGFSEKNKIVGGLFRLEPGKRPELWVEAFEYARERNPDLRGIIVGGGRLENSLREWVNDSGLSEFVKIIGETEDVGGWLSVMDIFLFASLSEGLPNVLIEAQGFGVPVVSTSVGGVPEIVSDGKTGILTISSSSEDLGSEIVKLIGDESFHRMGEFAKREARARFSVEKMASRTCEMYSRVLSGSEN